MFSPSSEKRVLQSVVAVACLVPLSAGLWGMTEGAQILGGGPVNLDSHFRYLSGLLFAIGLCFLSTVPNIEHNVGRMRLLTVIVFIGGLGRLAGFLLAGVPGNAMQAAAGMELVVTPLLCLWQHRVSRRILKTAD